MRWEFLSEFSKKIQSLAIKKLWVAFSGGLDSHVLLHLISPLKNNIALQAIHVNHNLSPRAKAWEQHCLAICKTMDIPCLVLRVDASAQMGESPEAAARAARYAAFAEWVQVDECLMTAHHQNDQAETLLLQWIRGAGPKGLSAMPFLTQFARGYLCRPLLDTSRASVMDYATTQHLQWIEDESNSDLTFDRNYLRHQVMPLLKDRWPAVIETLARGASHCAQTESLLNEFLAEELVRLAGSVKHTLSREKLLSLSSKRQAAILRSWLQSLGLSMPTAKQLHHIRCDVLQSRYDAVPRVCWSNIVVRRYGDDIYAENEVFLPETPRMLYWDLQRSLALPSGCGQLTIQQKQGVGIWQDYLSNHVVTVRFRQGGERCRPVGRDGSRSLKKLMQEWRIPPWRRDRVPLLYVGETLASVVGYCLCEPFVAKSDQIGIVITHDHCKPI